MKIYTNKIPNYIINVLTTYLLFSFTSLTMVAWGRYALLAISVAVFLISASKYCGGVKFTVEPFHFFMAVFAIYCSLTAIWAQTPKLAIYKATTIFRSLLCFSIIYSHFKKYGSTSILFSTMKWSGYAVALYTISVYGVEKVLKAVEAERLGSDFTNINTIGMVVAVTCVIQIWEIIERKASFDVFLLIPSVIIVAATQSRKAFIIIIVGTVGMILLKNMDNKKFYITIIKLAIGILFLVIMFTFLSKLSIFEGATNRLNSMFAGFKNTKEADSSTLTRLKMIEIGMSEFKNHPILGIGMNNILPIIKLQLGTNSYSHNNYVDLLAGGGLIGFVLYYYMYIYILFNLFKYRNKNKSIFRISIVLIFAMLVTDYGHVTYYSKMQWFYIMVHFLNIELLKGKAELYGDNFYENSECS